MGMYRNTEYHFSETFSIGLIIEDKKIKIPKLRHHYHQLSA